MSQSQFIISTMKIFQTVQMWLALSGYDNTNRILLNKNQKWNLVAKFSQLTLLYAHLLCVADSPEEYMGSILFTAAATLICVSLISTILKTQELFVFIDEIEDVVNASEF